MVVYDLACNQGHEFEGWFTKAQDYSEQLAAGLLQCPVCGSRKVVKCLSACHVHTRNAQAQTHDRPDDEQQASQLQQMLKSLQHHIDKYFVDVGTAFPEEARKIHYGEVQARNIRGHASMDEIESLHAEGVEVHPLPPHPIDKQKLN